MPSQLTNALRWRMTASNKPSIHTTNRVHVTETLFGHLGELADLENAICNQQKTAELTMTSIPINQVFSTTVNSQETRFGRLASG